MNTKSPLSLLMLGTCMCLLGLIPSYGQQNVLMTQSSTSGMGLIEPQYNLDYIPDYTYVTVEARIKEMETDMPFELNETIFSFINYFTVRNREYTRMVLARQNQYFPLFEKELRANAMPEDIKFLAVIESGLNPKARSRVGAMGLWQFMPGTGREYQLFVNQYVDDRMDPEKSTEAAMAYLKRLYQRFGDWELAMAAYNCGPGNVNKAIRRSGGKRSFWEIYNFLPRETRSYIPQFQAIMYVMRHAEHHNLYLENPSIPLEYERIAWEGHLDLMEISSHADICMEDLEYLNPSLVSSRIPSTHRTVSLKIPKTRFDYVVENLGWIQDTLAVRATQFVATAVSNPVSTVPTNAHTVTYRVKSGDVLGSIAQKYRVSVNNLKAWNGLSSNMIRVGQVLHIHQPNQTPQNNTLADNSAPLPTDNSNGSRVYTVQPGDSLWLISSKLEGVTIEQLKKLNNLNNNQIKPGQKLIIG